MADSLVHPGDSGESTLLDGTRLPKDHTTFEALGAVDELSAALGVARAGLAARGSSADAAKIREAQRVLVKIGAELATPPGSAAYGRLDRAAESDVAALDTLERALERRAPVPRGFVLPGATELEARIHVARTVCRAAERRLVSSAGAAPGHLVLALRYLNRLSSCLYWLALCYGQDA
jgi:cob(I)alamin adenosyltransferase